jgi:RHS repeat-associated protein
LTDQRGDVIQIVNQSGDKVGSYSYDAYGNVLSVDGEIAKDNSVRYASYYYDSETQHYYLKARYYDPENGNFLAMDTDPGDDNDSLSQNGYTYAKNNPISNVDPDGNFAFLVAVYFIPVIGEYVAAGTLIAAGAYLTGYGVWQLSRKVKAYFMNAERQGPKGKANRKKQGREVTEKKREQSNFKSRSNKNPNRAMKKHTPSKTHQRKRESKWY